MIGSNTIELNEATMKQALQKYFDALMPTGGPTVKSVKGSSTGYGGNIFTVELESPDEPIAA